MARALHLRERHAVDARKGRIGPALHTHHLRHRQSRGVQPVYTAGGEQVVFAHIGVGRHEAQLHTAAVARHRIAIGHATRTGADVEHGDGLVAVDQQRDLAHEREHARHLAEHASLVHHRRTQFHAAHLAAVQHHTARVRVGGVVDDLGRLGGGDQALAQGQQLPQAVVLQRQLLSLVGALAHGGHLLARLVQVLLSSREGLEVVRAVGGQLHRLEHQPLHGVQHRAHRLPKRPGELKARVGHHEEQRQGAVDGQTRKGRRPLLEERGSAALQGAKGHGAQRSEVAAQGRLGHMLRKKHWSGCNHAVQSEKVPAAYRRAGLLARENAAQAVHALQRNATTAHHAGQRVFGHQHRQAGLFG